MKYCNDGLIIDIYSDLASLGIMLFGVFLGSVSGLALLHGFAATGRTRFTIYRGWKCRLLGRWCICFVSLYPYGKINAKQNLVKK